MKKCHLLRAAVFFLCTHIATQALCRGFDLLPDSDVVGSVYTIKVRKGDTLNKIAAQYKISWHELQQANDHVDPRRLQVGQELVIPEQFILPPKPLHTGIVINVPELRLYYFAPDGHQVFTFPVGLGRVGWRTPTTKTRIIKKKERPTWHVPKSIQRHMWQTKGIRLPNAVLPGPKNPLGDYALYLARRGYLIHGTNHPSSVGRLASSGCVRMHNEDVARLFEMTDKHTPVTIIHHIYKAGWSHGRLYLEVHKPVSHNEPLTDLNHTTAEGAIDAAVRDKNTVIDWQAVETAVYEATGIPTVVGKLLVDQDSVTAATSKSQFETFPYSDLGYGL